MHIAICDDNIADRKQLERLLGRESDKRKAEHGVFYTDSYGEGDSVLPRRMSYDLFFVDFNCDRQSGLSFALSLCEKGVTVPIILCSSKTNYQIHANEIDQLPANLYFLDKPISTKELSSLLDRALIRIKNREKTIELRHNKDTYYVKEDELVYIAEKGRYLEAHLLDGQVVEILDTITNFWTFLLEFTHFASISPKIIVNVKYIDKYSIFKVTLRDGTSLRGSHYGYRAIRNTFSIIEYKERREENDN